MKYVYITSENPKHHWNYLAVKNEIVLDLGCGKHLNELGWLSTPEFFLSKGAKYVIGIDPHQKDIDWYGQHLDTTKSEFIKDCILNAPQLEHYFDLFKPTSVKMDIEGYEQHFIGSTHTFTSLKHIAIETHSRELFHDTLFKLLFLNFNITHICTFYPRVYDICNVIYATR